MVCRFVLLDTYIFAHGRQDGNTWRGGASGIKKVRAVETIRRGHERAGLCLRL